MFADSVNENIFTKNKPWLILTGKLLIALGILYYLISYLDYNKIVAALDEVDVLLISTAFLLGFVNIYLQFLKWKLTCKTVLSETKNSKILTSLFYGLSAGAVTPMRVGEYFGRAIAFKNKPVLQVTAATLADKFFPLMIVVFLGSIASIFFLYVYYEVTVYIVLALFVVVFTLFYLFGLLIRSENFWDGIFFKKLSNSKRFEILFLQLQALKKFDKKYFTRMSVISLLFYFNFLLQYALLVSAFSHNTELLNYLWAGNLIMFIKTVIPPISLGELGIREGASVFFLTRFGELSSVAFNASIFLFVINILFPALVGLFLLLKRNDD
ncbi:MAG: hypothetical protein BMS9Abin39_0258 [Ignavibacteria bacterium]|nr:MAG: hypothetical protein BMS9Abin39_0258 [Ignavibacteria bacterium]